MRARVFIAVAVWATIGASALYAAPIQLSPAVYSLQPLPAIGPTRAWGSGIQISVAGSRNGRVVAAGSLNNGARAVVVGDAGGFLPLALSGMNAPGTDGNFVQFEQVLVNDAGAGVFVGSISGGTVTSFDDTGIWAGPPGNLALVVRESATYGVPPNALSPVTFSDIRFNSRGDVAVTGFAVASIQRAALMLFPASPPGELRVLCMTSNPVPGLTGVQYQVTASSTGNRSPQGLVLGNGGHAAFCSRVTTNAPVLMLAEPEGEPRVVLQSNTLVPGTQTLERWFFDEPNAGGNTSSFTLNERGEIAFLGRMNNGRFLMVLRSPGPDGSWSVVAKQQEAAPGIPAPVSPVFLTLGAPSLNDRGEVAFVATIGGTGVLASETHGIWMGRPGNLSVVIRSGVQAPDNPPGVTIREFKDVRINNSGQVIFTARLQGPGIDTNSDTAVFAGVKGRFRLVMRANQSFAPTGYECITAPQFPALAPSRCPSDGGSVLFSDSGSFLINVPGLFCTSPCSCIGRSSNWVSGTAPTFCFADADGSDIVEPADLFLFLDRWFAQLGQSSPGLTADIDDNGDVSVIDLFVYLEDWFARNGQPC